LHGVLLVSLNWNLNDMIVQKENASLWSTPVCGEAALCLELFQEVALMILIADSGYGFIGGARGNMFLAFSTD